MLTPENTICGRCGKTCADNVPLKFRTKTECQCAPLELARPVPARELVIPLYALFVEYGCPFLPRRGRKATPQSASPIRRLKL